MKSVLIIGMGTLGRHLARKMIEYGTHNSLMSANGEYANMFNVQSQYYLEEDSDSEQIFEASHDMRGDF